jgi:hypothetical protein
MPLADWLRVRQVSQIFDETADMTIQRLQRESDERSRNDYEGSGKVMAEMNMAALFKKHKINEHDTNHIARKPLPKTPVLTLREMHEDGLFVVKDFYKLSRDDLFDIQTRLQN